MENTRLPTLGPWFSGRRYAKPTMLQYHEMMQGLREKGGRTNK